MSARGGVPRRGRDVRPLGAIRRRRGFTLAELMIGVAIIGLLAAVAVPGYVRFQLKAKSSEAKSNLASIRVAELIHYSEHGHYVPAAASPGSAPGSRKATFANSAGPGAGFDRLGWRPEGDVFFQYGVATHPQGTELGFWIAAVADLDADLSHQVWGYRREQATGNGGEALIPPVDMDGFCLGLFVQRQVLPCDPDSGQSVF